MVTISNSIQSLFVKVHIKIEKTVAKKNCSETIFELIYNEIHAFKVSFNTFSTVDFSNVPNIERNR